MLEGVHSDSILLEEVFASTYRSYYRLSVPKPFISSVLRTTNLVDPLKEWAEPISRLAAFIEEQHPDVVFLNGFGILNWMLLQAAQKTGVPVVIQHAGIWTKELNIHKDQYSEIGRTLMEQMERDSTKLSAVEIFLNRWSKEYYHAHVTVGETKRTEIVPLPFDFASFNQLSASIKNSQFNFDKKIFHIGIIARWDEIKNHKAILALAKSARAKRLPWQFHSVVEIPEKYAAEKKKYERYVDIIPPLDRVGISDFCRSVDLLLLPSIFDVSPTVVLEAMALNTPIVISRNIGYVSDFEKHGAQDWIIDADNTDSALQAIRKIAKKSMPSGLRNRILTAHDHKKVFADYLNIFAGAKLRGQPFDKIVRTVLKESLDEFSRSADKIY